jgi:HEAT repeat protein
LLERIDDDHPSVRGAAASACVRVEHDSRLDALLHAVNDADSWVRYAALKALSAIGAKAALPVVMQRLHTDPAVPVRLAAIDALGRLDPPEALEVLEPLARSHEQDVARAAIGALGYVARPEALAALERAARAAHPWQRLAAVDALARRVDTKVTDILQWAAAADDDSDVVRAAIDALTRVGLREGERQGSDATRALIALTEEPTRRRMAIAALGSLPPRRIDDVAAGLRHPSAHARCASVEALGRMRHPDASRAIESALNDPSPTVRLAAVAELKHLGTRSCQGKLMALARTDPDAEVRHAAVMAITRTESRGELSR